jgi:hypothetical protein
MSGLPFRAIRSHHARGKRLHLRAPLSDVGGFNDEFGPDTGRRKS